MHHGPPSHVTCPVRSRCPVSQTSSTTTMQPVHTGYAGMRAQSPRCRASSPRRGQRRSAAASAEAINHADAYMQTATIDCMHRMSHRGTGNEVSRCGAEPPGSRGWLAGRQGRAPTGKGIHTSERGAGGAAAAALQRRGIAFRIACIVSGSESGPVSSAGLRPARPGPQKARRLVPPRAGEPPRAAHVRQVEAARPRTGIYLSASRYFDPTSAVPSSRIWSGAVSHTYLSVARFPPATCDLPRLSTDTPRPKPR